MSNCNTHPGNMDENIAQRVGSKRNNSDGKGPPPGLNREKQGSNILRILLASNRRIRAGFIGGMGGHGILGSLVKGPCASGKWKKSCERYAGHTAEKKWLGQEISGAPGEGLKKRLNSAASSTEQRKRNKTLNTRRGGNMKRVTVGAECSRNVTSGSEKRGRINEGDGEGGGGRRLMCTGLRSVKENRAEHNELGN